MGSESGNAAICAGRTLGWTQDTSLAGVWDLWQVANRDCVVLDPYGRVHAVVNLTTADLGSPANRAALKAYILAARNAPPP